MRTNKKILILAACAILFAGYWFLGREDSENAELSYTTSPLSRGKIESIVNTAGTISPVVTVEVGSEISGLISELNADYNSEVKSGDVIARIDDRTVRSRLKQAEADLASAIASLAQQKANYIKSEADLTLARAELARQKELRARELNSQVDLDQAIATAKIAEAELEVSAAQTTAAEANILQSEAQLEQAQLDVERTYIRSPVDGTVIDRQVDLGQTVAASLSAPTLFQIAQDLTKMQIEADVDEADIGKVAEGMSARFSVDAFPESTFDGVISQVRKASTIANNVVTYKVIVTADNRRSQLLPGMTASVDIILGVEDDVLRVANGALRFNPPEGEAAEAASSGREDSSNAQLAATIAELGLSDDQAREVSEAVEEMTASIRASRSAETDGGSADTDGEASGERARPDRTAFAATRQKLNDRLSEFLNEEQISAVLSAMRGGSERSRNRASDEFSTGQVWIVNEDGKPQAVTLRTGLSDDLYTQVVSEDLTENDEVIIRIARTAQ